MILNEDDVIEWDEQYPPSLGEEHIQREECVCVCVCVCMCVEMHMTV